MTREWSLSEAEHILDKYIPLSRQITGRNITLGRMKKIMATIGNPEQSLKVIHIAGTSGKTSTTYYINALLNGAGYKTGMTISPHIDSPTERIQIDGRPISGKEFAAALKEFLGLIPKDFEPTYFELLVAMAYWYFAKEKVDYAVIETGMGGLHDGTNVAERADKLCVITDIGYDHMHVLGSTLPEIATQKAGIIHPGNTAIMYRQPDVIIGVVQDWCRSHQAELHFHNQNEIQADLPAPTLLEALPEYQKRNFLLAFEAYKWLKNRDNLKELTSIDLKKAADLEVPGRMNSASINGKTIIMDGAHNEQKMQAFVASYKAQHKEKATVLLSLKEGKEHEDILPLLLPITDTLIITSFSLKQDTALNSIEPLDLAGAAKRVGFKKVIVIKDLDEAYNRFVNQKSKIGIITGSFYMIGELRKRREELRHA